MKKEKKIIIEEQLKGINELVVFQVGKLENEKSKCLKKINELNKLIKEEQEKIREYVNFKDQNGHSRPLNELLEFRLIKENLHAELKIHEKLLNFYKNELKKIEYLLQKMLLMLNLL